MTAVPSLPSVLADIGPTIDNDLARGNVERAVALGVLAQTLLNQAGPSIPRDQLPWLMKWGEQFYRWKLFHDGSEYWKAIYRLLHQHGLGPMPEAGHAVVLAGAFNFLAGGMDSNPSAVESLFGMGSQILGDAHPMMVDCRARARARSAPVGGFGAAPAPPAPSAPPAGFAGVPSSAASVSSASSVPSANATSARANGGFPSVAGAGSPAANGGGFSSSSGGGFPSAGGAAPAANGGFPSASGKDPSRGFAAAVPAPTAPAPSAASPNAAPPAAAASPAATPGAAPAWSKQGGGSWNMDPAPRPAPPAAEDVGELLGLWVTLAFFAIAGADGKIDDREYLTWKQYMQRMKLPDVWEKYGAEALLKMLQQGRLQRLSVDFSGMPRDTKVQFGSILKALVLADGVADPREIAEAQKILSWLGITMNDVP